MLRLVRDALAFATKCSSLIPPWRMHCLFSFPRDLGFFSKAQRHSCSIVGALLREELASESRYDCSSICAAFAQHFDRQEDCRQTVVDREFGAGRMSRHGKMRASFDSETTSMGISPPQSPPRHPVYFVQSPSRESQDGGDYKPSFHSTPALSPSASPMHHSFIHHSSTSLSTEASFAGGGGGGRHTSRKVLPQPSDRSNARRKPLYKPWGNAILEEDDQTASGSPKRRGLSRCCMCGLSFLFCVLLLSIGAFVFWLVCQPRAPRVLVKDITFSEFFVVDGTQDGVPTRVLTANCTVKVMFHNPSKYFGLHISKSDVLMEYSSLRVGKGQVEKFYQAKDSKKMFLVGVEAVKVPLYGAGPNLQSLTQSGGGIPLQLRATLQSRAYVFWKLVKPRFSNYFSCDVTVNSSGKDFLKLLYKTCTYELPK